LFDRTLSVIPNVQEIGFGSAASDAWYMNIPAAAKQTPASTLLRGALNYVADGSIATVPTSIINTVVTNNAGTLQKFWNISVTSSNGDAVLPLYVYHQLTAGNNDVVAAQFYAYNSGGGTGKQIAISSLQGHFRFNVSGDGVLFGYNKGMIDYDGTNTRLYTLDTAKGILIGTANTHKLGFYGTAPIAQQALTAYTTDTESSAYTGAADGEAKLADLNALRVAYENLRTAYDDLRTKIKLTGILA
jgi:hypothetical protein